MADLHALLIGAAIDPPYVLVGHSLGAWVVMVYAGDYPDEIDGAVLVEARPPDASRQWLAALPPASVDESAALRGNRDEFTSFEHSPGRNNEGLDIATSAEQAKAAPGFGSKPLVVLSVADGAPFWEGLDPALAARLEVIRNELQTELATLSTNGRLVSVKSSGHDVPRDQPDSVVAAIQDVLAA